MNTRKNLNAMTSAFIDAGVSQNTFPKSKSHKPVRRQLFNPLVIETRERSKNGRMVPAKAQVTPVRHVRKEGNLLVATTTGGDMWVCIDAGNNYLKAVSGFGMTYGRTRTTR